LRNYTMLPALNILNKLQIGGTIMSVVLAMMKIYILHDKDKVK